MDRHWTISCRTQFRRLAGMAAIAAAAALAPAAPAAAQDVLRVVPQADLQNLDPV